MSSSQRGEHLDFNQLARLIPSPGRILLITGASGSGKSSLLRAMQQLRRRSVIDLNRVPLPNRAVVDCIRDLPLPQVLARLSRVGLAEAWTYLRVPAQLSEGQRWRLRLAIALHRLERRPEAVLVCDEFCALLDRVTAAVIAHTLRRAIDASGARAIVATSHDDLAPALRPDRQVICDFSAVRVVRKEES